MKLVRTARRTAALAIEPLVLPLTVTMSGTYVYPLEGISYFALHPILWAYLISILIPQLLLTAAIYFLFHTFLYPPQAAMAIFFNGPSGVFTAWIALIQEAAVASQLVSEWLLLPRPLQLMFDAVMSREGFDDLVLKARLKREFKQSVGTQIKRAAKAAPKALVRPGWVIYCLTKIFLQLIPVVGPVALVLIDAPALGRSHHQRYFELKGFDKKEALHYASERRGQYLGFGLAAGLLQTVPFISLLFTFSNSVGAALWAVNVERRLYRKRRAML